MTRVILWDNDGVLVETEGLYLRATREVLAGIGVPLTDEEFRRHFLVDSAGLRAMLPGLPREQIEALRARRNAIYAELLRTEPIAVDGAAEVLEELHGRFEMGVVTSSLREHFDLIHARTGFQRYFRFVLASGDYAHAKPHPAPYLAAVEAAGVAAAECLVVEDSLRGLTSARAAGLRTWVIPGRLTGGSDFGAAERILSSIREVPRWLGGGGAR